jgi:NAD(P)-dependent dehydrogenase (short-subunit alcohol dehydrogenase family)
MTGQFSKKRILIAGGGSGIGKAAALAFAESGGRVAIGDISAKAAEHVANEVRRAGGEALAFAVDVTCDSEVGAFVRNAVDTFGNIDIAVNCAGISNLPHLTADITEEDFDRVVSVNLKGVWLCLRHEIAAMLVQGSGSIINMSSILGLVGMACASPYAASKHGVIGLTKSAALEYANRGLRINAVCPGVIHTPLTHASLANKGQEKELVSMHPIGRVGQVSEVVSAIQWLASDGATFVTGSAVSVDGGWAAR